MNNNTGDIYALIDEKISQDTDFQNSLETMSDEDKEQAIADKKSELIKTEFAKAQEYGVNQKIRAEKAEAEAKKPKETETPKKEEYSLKDYRALSDVHDDDVDDIIEFAKFKNITIAEAKVNPTMQALLKTKAEERRSAEVANTGKEGGRSSYQPSANEIIAKVKQQGDPESDEEAERLAEARMQEKLAKIKR